MGSEEMKFHYSKKMAPSNTKPKNQHNWKMFSRKMVLSILKLAATFTAGVGELPKIDDNTGLLLDFGLVWVGEVGWIAELLEGSEDDLMEACAVMAWVPPQLRSVAVMVLGQLTNSQAIASVIAFQSSTRPDVRSPQAFVISETTTPGKFARSDVILPVSMSLKIWTASVIAASAAPTISVGKLAKIPTIFLKALMASSGRSWMIVGTLPCSSSSRKVLASSASFSNLWMVSQGMSLRRRTIFSDRKRPWTIRLLIASVYKRLNYLWR